jgi:acyl carrier protein phosphodiesterase
MNILAHFYLSGENEELMIGNFIADHVKGKQFLTYPKAIQQGILLHRQIDSYTDTHELVAQSKVRLREKYRHYAGVIVDIFYDHFLAVNWKEYSNTSLSDFTKKIDVVILKNHDLLPEKSALFFQYMQKYNAIDAYTRIEGIRRVLTGMSKRTPYPSGMEYAADDLQAHYTLFQDEFKAFFPQLAQFSKDFIQKNRLNS